MRSIGQRVVAVAATFVAAAPAQSPDFLAAQARHALASGAKRTKAALDAIAACAGDPIDDEPITSALIAALDTLVDRRRQAQHRWCRQRGRRPVPKRGHAGQHRALERRCPDDGARRQLPRQPVRAARHHGQRLGVRARLRARLRQLAGALGDGLRQGPDNGRRVARGGGFESLAAFLRSTKRLNTVRPANAGIGFRLARPLDRP